MRKLTGSLSLADVLNEDMTIDPGKLLVSVLDSVKPARVLILCESYSPSLVVEASPTSEPCKGTKSLGQNGRTKRTSPMFKRHSLKSKRANSRVLVY